MRGFAVIPGSIRDTDEDVQNARPLVPTFAGMTTGSWA